ncbi:MAG: hypothetical protein GKC53_04790 [Neisseriaceae bacterium]|nr:MAG: hypothetical protein GKC53_04790 [Neisseriaceae bacterium]
MFKNYVLLTCLLIGSTACAKNVNMTKANSINDFFAPKEYENDENEKKCMRDNINSFDGLTYCLEIGIDKIKKNIKQKLINLNKSESILDTELNKIKIKCRKKAINSFKEDDDEERSEKDIEMEEAPTVNSLTADCIKYDLYQFGRNLK